MTTDTGSEQKEWSPESSIPDHVKKMISQSSTSSNFILSFLHIIQELKKTPRTGWLYFDIEHPESIADHMYRMSIISLLSKSTNLDKDKCVKISIVHDMAESLVGDITPTDPMTKEEKHKRELAAILYLTENLIKPYNLEASIEILELWNEYENIESDEAIFVKDVDKFEMMLQAFEYEKKFNREKNLEEFFSAEKGLKTDEVKQWAKDLLIERKKYWDNL